MIREAEIEAREKAATKGPWQAEGTGWISAPLPGGRPNGEIIARFSPSRTGMTTDVQQRADAEFTAHAREDIPHLLAELKEAQEKLKAVEEILASAPPTDRVRRIERILKGGE